MVYFGNWYSYTIVHYRERSIFLFDRVLSKLQVYIVRKGSNTQIQNFPLNLTTF